MASELEQNSAVDDTTVVSPEGDAANTALLREGEITQALEEEEWPVAEFYRIEPDEDVASASHEDGNTVFAIESAPANAGRRGFPPAVGPTSLAVLVGAIGAIILAAIVVHLFRDSNEPATAGVPAAAASDGSAVTSPSTSPTSASSGVTALRDVKGMSLQEGRRLLERAGLRTRVRRVNSDRPRDEVLNQSPAAGGEIQKDRLVILVVSKGAPRPSAPASAEVPRVVGLAASDAVAELRDAAFEARIRLVESSEPAGTVIRQLPGGNTHASSGVQIVLYIAKRQPAPERVEVPDVAGLTASAARRALKGAGFTVTVISVPSDEPVGAVVSQSPHAGAKLRKGTAVTVRVSSGPGTVEVPSVIGLDEESARLALENAGFRVDLVDESTADPEKDGVVVAQSPPGDSAAKEGGVVTITVARLG